MILRRLLAGGSWRPGFLAVGWALLSLYYVVPVSEVLAPNLDSSIRATYAYFTAHGFQFGSEVNTTAGPYGFVMYGWDYGGDLFWPRWLLTLLFSAALAALVLWFFLAARSRWVRWLWLAAAVLGIEYGDNEYNLRLLLGALFLAEHHQRANRRVATLLVIWLFGCLSLMKGTQLAVAFGIVAALAFLSLSQRAWRSAAFLVFSFLISVVFWWAVAGQNPLHLPTYVNHLRHIAQGYNEAMALYESPGVFQIGLSLLVAIAALLGLRLWLGRREPATVASVLMLVGIGWVAWKHGYVRADGHAFVFLDLGFIIALTVVARLDSASGAAPQNRWSRAALFALAAGAGALSLRGAEILAPGRFHFLLTNVAPRFQRNVAYVFSPGHARQQADAEVAAHAQASRFSKHFQATVGRSSIDFYGHEMGLLLLGRFNYQPAPMCCGSYHVYNRYFKELNLRHFSDPQQRPEYLLLKLQSIDQRFVPGDDSLSLLAFLDLYRPVIFEHQAVLLKNRGAGARPQTPRVISTSPLRWDQDITVPETGPDELLLFSVNLPESATGALRAFVYKPPLVWMSLEGDESVEHGLQRVLPASLGVPALLSPALEKTEDYLSLFTDAPPKKVKRFRLQTAAPGCFRAAGMSVTFWVVQRPPALSAEALRRVNLSSVFEDPPETVEPPNATVDDYKNVRVQYLHTPASFTYHLRGDERRFSMTVGMDEQSYLTGRTDGVDFYVELLEPGVPPRTLLRRYLQPLSRIEDRGNHRIIAALPPSFAEGSRLRVRADPGPNHDAGWDWAFATDVKFARGSFVTEQFPGFKTLPISCDARSVSPLRVGDRDLVMVGAPGGMTFRLKGTERELRLTVGMLEGSYAPGNTDGVEFTAAYQKPDGSSETVLARRLQPKSIAADRGDQSLSVTLPPAPPGTLLHLRSNPGPAGDISFDWSYISDFELR
jgi:hypothetical protein